MEERKKMRYLVTGAGGFIGGWLYRTLINKAGENDVVIGITRSNEAKLCYEHGDPSGLYYSELEKPAWIRRLLFDLKPDVIFHFAGCATVSSPPDKIWSSNVDTTFNLLQYAPKGCRFILASSINAAILDTVYAASKRSAENLIESYSRQNHIDGVSVRLCAVAGAYNTHGVVKAVVEKLMKDNEVKLLTDSCKPFLYVRDVAEKIIGLTNPDRLWTSNGQILELCPYGNVPVTYIVNTAKKLSGIDKKFYFTNESWLGDDDYVSYYPNYASEKVFGEVDDSTIAVEKAIKDILNLEYGVTV